MTGHADEIQNIVYSPQEDLLASYDKGSTARLWDVESGVCRHILTGHSKTINDIAFSPQGTQVVTGSSDFTGRLWDVETGNCQHVLTGHSETCGYVNAVAYSPLGDQAITFSTDNSIKFWDVTSGACVQILTSSIGGIHRFMLLPDGNRIVTTSSYSMELWDVKAGECSKVLKGHAHFVFMACAPQGNQIATTSLDGTFRQWDLETGECRRTLKGSSSGQLAYSPSGRFILYARDVEGRKAKSCLRDAETGESFWELDDRFAGIAWIDSETVDSFITGGRDGSVKVWDVLDGSDRRRRVRLRWTSTNGRLVVKDTCIQDVKGLSPFNKQLLEQRGAVNEPVLY
jgi:WD40 repeat protein